MAKLIQKYLGAILVLFVVMGAVIQTRSLEGTDTGSKIAVGYTESSTGLDWPQWEGGRSEIEMADVVLLLIDANKGYSEQDAAIEQRLQQQNIRRVYTKADLLAPAQKNSIEDHLISTLDGQGMDRLVDQLTANYHDYNHDQSSFIARKRHVEALQTAILYLQQAADIFTETASGELMAEDLRLAQQQLNQIKDELMAKREQMHATKAKYYDEAVTMLRSEEIDQVRVKEIIAEHRAQMDEMIDLMVQRFAEFHSTLTPEQKAKLVKKLEDFHKWHHNGG